MNNRPAPNTGTELVKNVRQIKKRYHTDRKKIYRHMVQNNKLWHQKTFNE